MNKEQFKISISNLINEYVDKMILLNLDAANKSPEVIHMYSKQAQGLSAGFSEALGSLIDSAFVEPEEEKEEEVDE